MFFYLNEVSFLLHTFDGNISQSAKCHQCVRVPYLLDFYTNTYNSKTATSGKL